ncbi:hypothetical protein EDD17DRAFT_960474 [Pisolithus thermaeus]|nr:hypothetical protein EDD17DRAFT_960474 [Pisolithus thermaeus]
METYGRERRHRYFTNATYRAVLTSENLQDASAPRNEVDSSHVGGFAQWDPGVFYGSDADFVSSVTGLKRAKVLEDDESEIKRRRLNDGDEVPTEEKEVRSTPKRGRPRKVAVVDSSRSEAPRKRGRPRKHPLPEEGPGKRGRPPNKKRRGSPGRPMDVSMELAGENLFEVVGEGVVMADSTTEDPDRQGDMEIAPETVDRSQSLEAAHNEPVSKSPQTSVIRLNVTSEVPSQSAVSRGIVEGVRVPTFGSLQRVTEPESVVERDMQASHRRMAGIAGEEVTEIHSFSEAQTDEGPCVLRDERRDTNEQPPTPVDSASASVVEPPTVESSTDYALPVVGFLHSCLRQLVNVFQDSSCASTICPRRRSSRLGWEA